MDQHHDDAPPHPKTESFVSSSMKNNDQPRRSSLPPFGGSVLSSKKKAPAKKKASSSARRRASSSCVTTVNRRGHSDMALESSSGSAGLSHLMRPGSKKRLRRSISWDVRPPKVHELKRCSAVNKATAEGGDRMDEGEGSRNESWYSKEEYSDIIKEQMKSIMIMRYLRENGTDDSGIDPEVYCERGLESYQSKERRHEIDTKRKLHRFLVIREQARQVIVGTKDPELLRQMASTQSQGSLMKAQLRAALDQHEASQTREKPLTEQEKLQLALEQHDRMIRERHSDMDTSQSMQQTRRENSFPESSGLEDPTSGIIPLASLWAQESVAEDDAAGLNNVSCPRPSSPSYVHHQGFFKKSLQQVARSEGQRTFSLNQQNHGMPLVGFQNLSHPSSFAAKPSAPVQSPQAIQNAFCSSMAHSYTHQQQHPQHQKKFQSRNNSNGYQSAMPTSAFAALNLHQSQQSDQTQALNQQQEQRAHDHQRNNIMQYASMLGHIPR